MIEFDHWWAISSKPYLRACFGAFSKDRKNWREFVDVLYSRGEDPGFFLGGGAPLRNDVTDRWGKQILKANTKKASSQGGVCTPCTLPLDPLLLYLTFKQDACLKICQRGNLTSPVYVDVEMLHRFITIRNKRFWKTTQRNKETKKFCSATRNLNSDRKFPPGGSLSDIA